jgi:alkanesulfonate monooxygenase SsuD/methylene tetrahydromethanopterin reductase-like flavin-dependent oxidoreductase (luciferase family)
MALAVSFTCGYDKHRQGATSMKFGISLTFSNPGGQIPVQRLIESQIAHTVLADELGGFDYCWMAEHHGSEHYFPAQLTMLSVLATKTKRIRLGSGIIVMPLYHPLHVAEQALIVDLLSQGRFELGLGIGNFQEEFDNFGISRTERASRMEESLQIISGVWSQKNFSFSGKHFKVRNFSMNPRPVQAKAPIWLAGNAPKAIERAARLGYHFAGSGTGYDLYEQKLREYGRNPADFNKSILMQVVLAKTSDEAWRRAAKPLLSFLKYYKEEFDRHEDFEWFRQKPGGYFGVDPLPDPADIENVRRLNFLGSPLVVGTPDEALEHFRHVQAMGVTHPVLSQHFGGMDPAHSEETIRLMTSDVIPHFR